MGLGVGLGGLRGRRSEEEGEVKEEMKAEVWVFLWV